MADYVESPLEQIVRIQRRRVTPPVGGTYSSIFACSGIQNGYTDIFNTGTFIISNIVITGDINLQAALPGVPPPGSWTANATAHFETSNRFVSVPCSVGISTSDGTVLAESGGGLVTEATPVDEAVSAGGAVPPGGITLNVFVRGNGDLAPLVQCGFSASTFNVQHTA